MRGTCVDTLTAQDVQRVDVMQVGAKQPPPQGKAIYSRQNNGLIFVASKLLPLPAQKAYELWIIPTKGAPIPAGVFKPDAHGGAMVINPPIPAGVEAKAFAITIEPEAGSTTPTMPIVMLGGGRVLFISRTGGAPPQSTSDKYGDSCATVFMKTHFHMYRTDWRSRPSCRSPFA